MVSYTTEVYYTDSYLMGRTAVISTALIPYYLLKATNTLKKYTLDNVDETIAYPDEIQMCVCELADCIYKAEHEDTKGITSEKVGEYSVAYESAEAKAKMQSVAIRSIIYNWLTNTSYLERGIS